MKSKKLLAAVVLFAGVLSSVSAQSADDRNYGKYTFIGVQGGGQLTFTNYKNSKLITPIGAFSVGHFFSPEVGARLNVSGWKNKGGIDAINKTYDYNYVTTDLDFMFNLCNIFSQKDYHRFNAYLIGGVGLSYAWDNDDLNQLIADNPEVSLPYAWEDNRLVHNFRVGVQLEANIVKSLGVNLEVTANNLHDRFNSKTNGHGDWQLTAAIGLTYKFGFGRNKAQRSEPAPKPAPAPAPAPAPEPKPEPKPQPKPEPKPQPKPAPAPAKTRIEVFFTINSSTMSAAEEKKVADLAAWLKQHPSAQVELVGYADAGTGTAEINRAISEKRAAAVNKALIEKYGISASRIKYSFKGDTVQPFGENDKNRVVIGLAEEKK